MSRDAAPTLSSGLKTYLSMTMFVVLAEGNLGVIVEGHLQKLPVTAGLNARSADARRCRTLAETGVAVGDDACRVLGLGDHARTGGARAATAGTGKGIVYGNTGEGRKAAVEALKNGAAYGRPPTSPLSLRIK